MEEYDVSTNNITPSENVNFKINKTHGKVMIDGTCSKVDIYAVSGVRVLTYNKMNDSGIDITKLNKGIYVLVIDGKNRFKFSY